MEARTDPTPRLPAIGEYRGQTLARTFVALFLAAAAGVATLRGYLLDLWPPLVVCTVVLAYNGLLVVTSWLDRKPGLVTVICLLVDVLALTVYLHYTGDIENPLMFAYSLPVVAGAVLVSSRAGFLLSATASLLFFLLMCLTTWDAAPVHLQHHHLGLLGGLDLTREVDPDTYKGGWSYILAHLLVLVGVLFGSAAGFGALAEKLRQKETDLRHQNERLLLLLSILPEGVVLLGNDGTILHQNSAAGALVNGAEGRSVRALDARLGLADRFERFQGSVEEFETGIGDRVYEHALARRTAQGPVVWVFRDTTDHRRLMAQVMHRSKMVDLGLLAAGIAHEIGNPLSSMSAILQLLQLKVLPPEVTDRLRAVETHVGRIHRIVQDITGFARPSAGHRSRVDGRALLDKALQIFRFHEKAKEIKVEVVAPEPLVIEVVEDQGVQVLLNILLNAADASEGRGLVTVTARRAGGEARIAIADRGSGIGEETRRRLFTPFFTTKDQGKGAGLGLFISESIARAHGGRVEVESSPGKGSTFTLCLPLASSKVAS